jgi:muramidase (phage lysozyme)
MSQNLKAFLHMLAHSELGDALLAVSDDGYDVLVGSTASNPRLFRSYAKHPNQLITMVIRGRTVQSTAAGRYQILSKYFTFYKNALSLNDFGHDAQDAIAVQMIRECKALEDIEAGRFAQAVEKCRSRWASLPGAGYDQHENKLADLQTAYVKAGGKLS